MKTFNDTIKYTKCHARIIMRSRVGEGGVWRGGQRVRPPIVLS